MNDREGFTHLMYTPKRWWQFWKRSLPLRRYVSAVGPKIPNDLFTTPSLSTRLRGRYAPGSSSESKPIDYTTLEEAYASASVGAAEPSFAVMSTSSIIHLYRQSHPVFAGTDDDVLALLRASKLVVSFGDGIWVLCRDEASADAIRENGLP